MSGLVALLHRDGRPVEAAAIQAMLDAAPYRGLDGRWARCWGEIGLGYGKLATTPEEVPEQQPLVSSRTGCALIADARLDNREDLLGRFPDRLPWTVSDAALILRAYEAWGDEAAARLLGDFAFVLWDPRQRRLLCARDTSGQRTLFYRVDRGTFAAASEIQQLLQDPTIPVAPNEARIREFLVPLSMSRNEKDHPDTFYAGIQAVPAGHVVTVDAETLRVRRYWELQPPAELRYRDEREYAEHYRALFFEVVRARLRCSRPLGALLSGGLDSSSVVCAAQELYRAGSAIDRGFTSFSFLYDGLVCDERDLIGEIQAKYGLEARFIPAAALGGWLRPEPDGFQESPNVGASELRNAVLGAVCQTEIRALLTGDLADSCVGGAPPVFDSLLRQGQLPELWRRLRVYRRTSGQSLRAIVALDCLAPLLPLGLQRQLTSAYLIRQAERNRRDLLPYWLAEALREELVERHLAALRAAERQRRFSNPARQWEYSLLYPPEVTRNMAPWPVEIWRPFADRRLHEFLLAVPPEQKFAPPPDSGDFYAASKQLPRRALRGILPESIRTRKSKTVFSATFRGVVERQWPLYEATFGPGARSEVAERGYVDPKRFWARLIDLRAGLEGADFMYLQQIVSLETWLRALRLPRPRLVTVPSPPTGSQPSGDPRRESPMPIGRA